MGQTGTPKILVIDDEVAVVDVISDALREEGMEVLGVTDAEQGLRAFYQFRPDAVVLDLKMPRCDGWELCRRLRQVSFLPILMLTACSDGQDLIRGLNLGADDYMTKPFSLEILSARVRALLRRSRPQGSTLPILQAGDVTVDLVSRKVTVGERVVALTSKEFDLLACLVRNAGRIVLRNELVAQVWGDDACRSPQLLNLYIWYLRNRIEENPRKPRRITTWRGVGYRFVPVGQAT